MSLINYLAIKITADLAFFNLITAQYERTRNRLIGDVLSFHDHKGFIHGEFARTPSSTTH